MDAPELELVCPRCGEDFSFDRSRRELGAARQAWDRYVHHAQRDHDLDEIEAYHALMLRDRSLRLAP